MRTKLFTIYNIQEEIEEDIMVDSLLESKLIVYNDEVNTFEWVIECLVEVLKHSLEQAEQCTLMIHNNGKCIVKSGSIIELLPYKDSLCERGLFAVID